jgi:hypothetical protein
MPSFAEYFEEFFNEKAGFAGADKKRTDSMTRAFIAFSKRLRRYITTAGIIGYIQNKRPVILEVDLKKQIASPDVKGVGIVVFDTETTGLRTRSGVDSYGKMKQRNQIYELAAITYDSKMKANKKDYFHGKVPDQFLNMANSVQKTGSKVAEKLGRALTDSELDAIESAYAAATVENKFKPDWKIFSDKLPESLKAVGGDLYKITPISKIRVMTKADKEIYNDVFTQEQYQVKMFKSEMAMIENFLNYIDKQKENFDEVYIIAHNLNYDKSITLGALEDAVAFWESKAVPTMVEKSKALLQRAEGFFNSSVDTLDGFKRLFAEKNYITKIKRVAELTGIDGIKLLNVFKRLPKTKTGKYSTSLGKISPKSINKEWHSAINDVYVTIETVKMYYTIPMILSMLRVASIKEDFVGYGQVKIPKVLLDWARETKFGERYTEVDEDMKKEELLMKKKPKKKKA